MPRRTFRSELATLVFALKSNGTIAGNPDGNNILNDCDLALQYYNIREKKRKYLLWGMLIGRSADSFTAFFMDQKGMTHTLTRNDFSNRIRRICNRRDPLTSDPTVRNDLNSVRTMRNDLFHTAGRHFNDNEMERFVFQTVRCLQQLLLDL